MADSKITDLSDGGAVVAADEFVVARSGANNKISGSHVMSSSLLVIVEYAPATLADYSVTATGTPGALDTTNVTTGSFTVPDSGKVIVRFSASLNPPAGTNSIGLALLNHSGGAQVGRTIDNVLSTGTGIVRLTIEWYLSGLSAGSLGLDVAAGVTGGTGHVYAQGHTGAVNGGKTGPALLIVQAA